MSLAEMLSLWRLKTLLKKMSLPLIGKLDAIPCSEVETAESDMSPQPLESLELIVSPDPQVACPEIPARSPTVGEEPDTVHRSSRAYSFPDYKRTR